MNHRAMIHLPTLKALSAFAAGEGSGRFYIEGVLLYIEPNSTTFVATTGHHLAARRLVLADADERNTLTGKFIVPKVTAKGLKAKKADPFGTLTALVDGQMILDGAAGSAVFRPIDGEFPAWERIVPETVSGTTAHGFNGSYLADVWEMTAALGLGAVRTHVNGDGPAAFSFDGDPNAIAVVMPYRSGADATWSRPNWISP
jgi:hypothetical protein